MRNIRSTILATVAGVALAATALSSVIAADSGTNNGRVIAQRAPVLPASQQQWQTTATAHIAAATADPATLARLQLQKQVLNAQGVTDLYNLGTLTISGTVVPQPGFVRAAIVSHWNPNTIQYAQEATTTRGAPMVPNPPGTTATQTAPAGRAMQQPAPGMKAMQAPPMLPGQAATGAQPPPAQTVTPQPSNMTTAPTTVQTARGLPGYTPGTVVAGQGRDGSGGRPAIKIIGTPLVLPAQTGGNRSTASTQSTIPIDSSYAYWVGSNVSIAPNTVIVIQPNVRHLVIVADTLTIGANVTLTYEDVPVMNPPAVPGKPSTAPPTPGTPNPYTKGVTGTQGYPGTQPPQIGTPPDAPQVELWSTTLNQLPTVILKGQHGYKGVQGGGGGDGGRGGNGSDSDGTWYNCNDGPDDGGTGGKGGHGANGGQGGNGGTGGIWSLYTSTLPTSMTVDVSGGERGDGGDPGAGGNGGPGGNRGAISGYCANQSWGNIGDGSGGPGGDSGVSGPDGAAGALQPNSINQVVLDPLTFSTFLNGPHITTIGPQYPLTATVGSTVTINGVNFVPDDIVTINGVVAPVTFMGAPSTIVVTVPNTWGGVADVKVTRAANPALSTTGTLYIAPTIVSTVPPSPSSRLKPGDTITVNGTGFSHQMSVRVNHIDVATVTAATSQSLSFVMVRPASIPYDPNNAAGEPAVLSVASSGPIMESPTIPIVIATFQMLVIGDSVIWGEGLQDPDKIHSLVQTYEGTLHPGMSIYKTVRAHTGATTGWSDPTSGSAYDGDIPKSDLTVHDQAALAAGQSNASTVDLVLMTSCANDVGFQHFLDPLATQATIGPRVHQFCHDDMKSFLIQLAGQFPNAKIVVAGYYQGLSLQSDSQYFIHLAGVFYGLEDNQGLGPDALAASVGISGANQFIVAGNAGYFASQANLQLAAAVSDANAMVSGPPRIVFVDPGFGPSNAANAPNAWVFGLAGVIPQATDSVTAQLRRKNMCGAVYNTVSTDYEFCNLASAGHPNETGAIQYFNAIKPHL